MDKKITKKMLEHLVAEEMENLSEEEMNELFGGIGRRVGAWQAGRQRKAKVKEWEAFKGNLGYKLNQLADMYEKAHANHVADIEKNPKLKAFADKFKPWTDADKGVTAQVKALKGSAQRVLDSPVEMAPDETSDAAAERTAANVPGAEEPAAPPVAPSTRVAAPSEETSTAPGQPSQSDIPTAPGSLGEKRKRLIKKAQQLLRENKKIRVTK